MVKGINRQVIEITDMESDFYERALLVVRPECAYIQDDALRNEAKDIVNKFDVPSCNKKRNNLVYWFVRLGGAAAIGAGLTLAAIFI